MPWESGSQAWGSEGKLEMPKVSICSLKTWSTRAQCYSPRPTSETEACECAISINSCNF